jgi:hypothetical protein
LFSLPLAYALSIFSQTFLIACSIVLAITSSLQS